MALLERVSSRDRFPLVIRTVIGRSHSCELRLVNSQASGLHAEIVWDGERWLVHDLGSRNGTYLDDQPLEAGQREPLVPGVELMFGTDGERFVLADASAPTLVAVADDGTMRCAAEGGLALPSDEAPQVWLVEQPNGGWRLETETKSDALGHRQRILVAGTCWCIHLPGAVRSTDHDVGDAMSIHRLMLEFRANRRGDHVEIRARAGSQVVDIKPRTHDAILLYLARARIADQQRPEIDEIDQGWVRRQDLCNDLNVDRKRLNLQLHRARQGLAEAGIADTEQLIEHRRGAKKLRIGVSRLALLGL